MTGRALEGRTVVVTRAGPRAARLVAALEHAGATVLELALTEQVDPADGGAALRAAAADLPSYAWVVLTSANALARLLDALGEGAGGGALRGVRVAVVGPASADALRAAGTQPDLVPPVHSAAGLVDAFTPAPAADGRRRVLFPAADLAPSTVVDGLAAKGWEVHRVEAYRTVALAPPDAVRVTQAVAADAVVFLAASSVRAFTEAVRPAAGSAVAPALVVCLGATTAAAARAAGLSGVQEAPDASSEGLVAALVEHLGSASGAGS